MMKVIEKSQRYTACLIFTCATTANLIQGCVGEHVNGQQVVLGKSTANKLGKLGILSIHNSPQTSAERTATSTSVLMVRFLLQW